MCKTLNIIHLNPEGVIVQFRYLSTCGSLKKKIFLVSLMSLRNININPIHSSPKTRSPTPIVLLASPSSNILSSEWSKNIRRWTDHHYISFSQQTYSNHNFIFNSILIPSKFLFFTSAPFRRIWITPINLAIHDKKPSLQSLQKSLQ